MTDVMNYMMSMVKAVAIFLHIIGRRMLTLHNIYYYIDFRKRRDDDGRCRHRLMPSRRAADDALYQAVSLPPI